MLTTNLILYGTLALCTLVTVWIVKRYDLYDHEPWWMLVLATVLGAGGMTLAGRVQVFLIARRIDGSGEATDLYQAFLAGTVEEGFKFLVVAVLAMAFGWMGRRPFNEPLDGVVLGSFAGLGAALEESVHVLSQSEPSVFLPPQEPIRLAGHLIMGGITCFGLGLFTLPGWSGSRGKWHVVWAVPVCYVLGAAMHTAWDVVAFAAAERVHSERELLWWQTWVPVALMVLGMLLYRIMVGWAASLTRFVLQVCDVRTKVCPPPQAPAP